MLFPAVLVLSQLVISAGASLVNVTIDDTRGDERSGRIPQYASVHAWNAGSAGTQCSVCGARPDGTKAFDKTWHDDTTFPDQLPSNVTFAFNGSIVYVFFILANNIDVVHKNTRLAFYLDGAPNPISQFLHEPDLTVDGFIYNQLVFRSAPDSLPEGEHSLLISSWADGDSGSIALFDYAIYSSTDDDSSTVTGQGPSPSSRTESISSTVSGQAAGPSNPIHSLHPSSSAMSGQSSAPTSSVGAAVGGSVAGAAMAIALLGLLAWYCIRRRRRIRHSAPPPEMVTAFRAPVTDNWAAESHPLNVHRGKGVQALSSPTSSRSTFSIAQFPSLHPGHMSGLTSTSEAAESARLRSELERTREELERVRQFAEPLPEYS